MHPRQRVVEAGNIRTQSGRSYACTVRDVSASGARLRIPLDFKPPAELRLNVPALRLDRTARVVWHHDNLIGVHFADE
ncbi:PilZ domain-containing protein [Bosea sp. PAMC 26642]|uniref:PilZ domain-containing protein n=1 Tax=Bosea sp. (strain PAMC 26642) TaxID=1792307 RepID=UPI00077048A5|nr:PilZ domain-containing protein [Bosea sp. PAMC 26642]AMJ61923.1 hypothetical protein AXW83_17910 [Bosea sp. PAMC 26642]